MSNSAEGVLAAPAAEPGRPPVWLVVATGILALGSLAMAVAETSLWMHYLIDAGESVSLAGLAFMTAAGIYLYRRQQLLVSLPLALPWLLFPVITQGDQIIDNLSITWMRIICHVLLAALFGFPVAVVVMAARSAVVPVGPPRATGSASQWLGLVPGMVQLHDGKVRQGIALLASTLLVAETWVAVRFLGLLMVITLIVMVWAVLVWGFWRADDGHRLHRRSRSEGFALVLLIAGVTTSLGLFFGYKNREGAYQGSPSYFMDPSQRDAGFRLDRLAVPIGPPLLPSRPADARQALSGYATALERLLGGYYILDRNYNYDFHNRLFLRSTPLVPNYRAAGLQEIAQAMSLWQMADAAAARVRPTLDAADPLAALLDDVGAFASFTFGRAPILERMSAAFEQTEAGLQHATHLYEGEGKVLGVQLAQILDKHRGVLSASALTPVTSEFVAISRAVHDAYANRIVGF
jgi:hypothetical protein